MRGIIRFYPLRFLNAGSLAEKAKLAKKRCRGLNSPSPSVRYSVAGIGLRLCSGKRDYSRDTYRRAQKAAVAAGVYSSQVAKRSKGAD
jgi:hypothetical protein